MNRTLSTFLLTIPFSVWLVVVVGCDNNTNRPNAQQTPNPNRQVAGEPTIKPIVDIPQLIGKSQSDLDKALGKPSAITRITDDPDMMPGEFRDYRIENTTGKVTQYGLMVRFHKGKAVHFTFDLPRLTDTPEQALLIAGINVEGTPKIKAPLADRWTGNFNGIDFKDVAALKMDSDGKRYSTVQAESSK